MIRFFLALLLTLGMAACTSLPPEPDSQAPESPPETVSPDDAPLRIPPLSHLRETPVRALAGRFAPANWNTLPGWPSADLETVWQALLNNCKGLMRPLSGSQSLPARAPPRIWHAVCSSAQQLGSHLAPEQVRSFLQQHVQPWRLLDANGAPAVNTITGYYEPLISAARTREGAYQWPLYAVPDDLRAGRESASTRCARRKEW